jgi:hypothetical protein
MKIELSTFTLVFLIFLVLKLTGNILWSWWYVTMPLWLPLCIGAGIAFACVAFKLFSD